MSENNISEIDLDRWWRRLTLWKRRIIFRENCTNFEKKELMKDR